MGLDFIRDKAEQFEQKRDDSKVLEIDVDDLLSRGKSDELVRLFQCQLSDVTVQIVPGLPMIARAYAEADVRIIQASKTIGHMLPDDAQDFTDLMRKNHRLAGMITVVAQDVPAIDGVFPVKPKTVFKNK